MRKLFALAAALVSTATGASIPIPYALNADGKASLAVYDNSGTKIIRTLLTGAPRKAGAYSENWDGLDRYGKQVPAGSYTWKLLGIPGQGLKSEFILGVGNNPTPTWERGVGNHVPPNAVAVDSSGVYLFAGMGEGGTLYEKTGFDGAIIWNFHSEQMWTHQEIAGRSVALVNGRAFSLCDNGVVYGFNTVTGQCFTNGNYDPNPWNIGANPTDIDGDWTNNLLVVCYKTTNTIAWRSTSTNAEVDNASGVTQPVAVSVSGDGTVYAISGGAVVKLSRTSKTPQTVIAASALQSPWRLSVDRKTGDIFVAENSDLAGGARHHQVKKFSSTGTLTKTFGAATGRTDGAYVPANFLHITDIAADGQGGFLVTEGDWTPPRRTVRIDANGAVQHEWLGGQAYGTMCTPEPNDPSNVWMQCNAPVCGLVRFHLDFAQKRATITDIFHDVFLTNKLGNGPGGHLSIFNYNSRMYIAAASGNTSLMIYDKANHSLRFTNFFKPDTIWNDKNDNGLVDAGEVASGNIGGFIDPKDMKMYALPWQTGYYPGAISTPQSFTAGGTPVYVSQNTVKYPKFDENGEKFDIGSLQRGNDGSWYGCFSDLFNAQGVPYAHDAIEPHGVWYFNSCSAIDRLVKLDANWNPLWSVGRHSADADHEIGSTAMARNVMGTAKGCVLWADGSDEEIAPPIAFTEDGLYVDELFHKADPSPEEVYGLNTQNEYSDGRVCVDSATGDVYMYYISNSVGGVVYKVTGWDGWQRSGGTVTLATATATAQLTGTGLKGEYYNNTNLTGTPALTRTDGEVYMVWCADAPGSGVNADNFSVRWSGKVEAPTTEEYIFSFETNRVWVCDGKSFQGVKLLIDNKEITNPNSTSGYWPGNAIAGRALLRAGQKYDIKCEAAFGAGDAVAWLCWETKSRDRRHIQKKYLYPETPSGAAVWSGGLQAQWKFDEGTGTSVADASGNSHPATLTSASWASDGVIGKSLSLGGTGASASCNIDVSETSYAASFWFKTTQVSGGLFSATDNGGGHDRDVWLDNGALKALVVNSSNDIITAAGAWADGAWHHVVHQMGGPEGAQRLYVDGVLRSMGTAASSTLNATSVRIGASAQTSSSLSSGQIDEVRVFNKTLSAREIADEIYRKEVGLIAYFPMDEAVGMHPSSYATLPGIFASFTGSANWTSGKFRGGVDFNATGRFVPAEMHVEHEIRLQETDYTIAFWFKSSSANGRLFKAARNSSYNNVWQDHTISLEGGKVRLDISGGAGSLYTTGTYNDGSWHQVVSTIGGASGVAKLYVDGTVRITGTTLTRNNSSNRLGIDIGPGDEACRVSMDELRVYGRALTGAEVTALYALTPDPITSVLAENDLRDESPGSSVGIPDLVPGHPDEAKTVDRSTSATAGLARERPMTEQEAIAAVAERYNRLQRLDHTTVIVPSIGSDAPSTEASASPVTVIGTPQRGSAGIAGSPLSQSEVILERPRSPVPRLSRVNNVAPAAKPARRNVGGAILSGVLVAAFAALVVGAAR